MADDSYACGMPVSRQIERLERALDERLGAGFPVMSVDLTGLEEDERHAVLDAIVAGDPSPYVVVGGRLVSTGAVSIEAVLGALG
jgi:hypothetical protein